MIREALLQAFASAEFVDISIMRFCQPGADTKRLLAFLKENRETHFGECEVSHLELILGDWYASAETVKLLDEYLLC